MRAYCFTLLISLSLLNISFGLESKISAEARLKIENFHDSEVSTSATSSHFRARFNIELNSNPYRIYFQFQDSRFLGAQKNSPGLSTLNQTPIDFHQIYGETKGLFKGKNKIRFGRFEMPLGKQRLFGKSGWGNYGRSFEGITNQRNTKKGDMLFFHLINSELYPMDDQFDHTINGIYGTTRINPKKRVSKQAIESESFVLKQEPFYLDYYLFSENIVLAPESNIKQRQTIGLRITKKFKRFNLESEFAYQSGKYYSDNIDASLSSINIHVPIDRKLINGISFSKEYLSGDEYQLGGSDGVLGGFAKPFGSGHSFHGYYDNPLHKSFLDNTHSGLNEWFIKTDHLLFSDINLTIKFHDFKDAINFDRFGNELDFVFSKKLPFGGKIVHGVSIYYPEHGSRLEAGYIMVVIKI